MEPADQCSPVQKHPDGRAGMITGCGGQVKHFKLPRKLVDRELYILSASEGKRVLHLGCLGHSRSHDWRSAAETQGWLHGRIRAVAREVIGVDIDREAVREARDQLGMQDIHWGDAQCLDTLGLGEFDLIVAGELVEHLSSPGHMLATAHSVLRKGGQLIITAPNAFCARKAMMVCLGRESVHEDHVAYYSHRTLERLATMHGYRVVEQCSYRLQRRKPLLPYVVELVVSRLFPNACEGVICRMQHT
jgi:2-polyprenyl-3-methyl-5-hydroxy-6-metoxy-1,4-benzoquinol methylase